MSRLHRVGVLFLIQSLIFMLAMVEVIDDLIRPGQMFTRFVVGESLRVFKDGRILSSMSVGDWPPPNLLGLLSILKDLPDTPRLGISTLVITMYFIPRSLSTPVPPHIFPLIAAKPSNGYVRC